ncbi:MULTISPECIES: hypothetical protein [Marinobacter]|uniref:hypothetical protein n=1 Tax=Marinobacter TaxID=2742 RepID=UPI000DAC367E|nr:MULTISPECIES: hypothetical protein [Marinobacter]
MGVLYVAFVLVCGFIFTSLHLPARYQQKRLSGWESYFSVALYGFVFVILATLIVLLIDAFDLPSGALPLLDITLDHLTRNIGDYTSQAITPRELLIALLAFFLATVSGYASKRRTRHPAVRLKKLRKACLGDELEGIFLDAVRGEQWVSLTLDTRKCYIGLVTHVHTEASLLDSISIIPTLSGYRRDDDLELVLLRNYYHHYEEKGLLEEGARMAGLSDFRIVIPTRHIVHVSFFDLNAYKSLRESQTIPASG